MELRKLPLDGIRPILALLDYGSLVWLHATFDRKIQALLRSPNALSCVSIDMTLPKGPARYFLWSLGEITRLEIPDDAKWNLLTLPLLTCLNPLDLSFGHRLINKSVVCDIEKYLKKPTKKQERQLSDMKPLGFPNLARLTPRLHTLHSRATFSDCVSVLPYLLRGRLPTDILSLPPTLTSLTLAEPIFDPKLIDSLPTTLATLDVQVLQLNSLSQLGNRLPELSSLAFKLGEGTIPDDALSDPDCTLPATLTSLRVECTNTYFPLFLFTSSTSDAKSLPPLRLQTPSLTHLSLNTYGRALTSKPINFTATLPTTISSLELTFAPAGSQALFIRTGATTVFLESLPPSLTHLSWRIDLDQQSLLSSMSELKNLTKLHVSSHFDYVHLRNDKNPGQFIAIPPNVRDLHSLFVDAPMDTTQIEMLPSTLTRVRAPMLLDAAEALRSRLPQCRITIEGSIQLWFDANGQMLQNKFWLNRKRLDLPSLIAAIQAYYSALKIYFDVHCLQRRGVTYSSSWTTGEWRKSADVFFHRPLPLSSSTDTVTFSKYEDFLHGFNYYDSSYHHFKTIDWDDLTPGFYFNPQHYPSLTRLDFGCSNAYLYIDHIPPCLTHLACSSTKLNNPYGRNAYNKLVRLRVFDTPHWTFTYSQLLRCFDLSDMDVFKCDIDCMEFKNLIPFLTQTLSPKTRSGTSVTICMLLDGSLVNDEVGIGPSMVDLATLDRLTDDFVQTQLSLPMPSSSSSDADLNTSSTNASGETIGHVVKAMRYRLHDQKIDEVEPHLMLPFCATTLSIEAVNGWHLRPNTQHVLPGDVTSSTTSDEAHAASAETSSSPPLQLPVPGLFSPNKNLTRLELIGIGDIKVVWASLPTSLRVLRLKAAGLLSLIDHRFPPQLETLVLESYIWPTPHVLGYRGDWRAVIWKPSPRHYHQDPDWQLPRNVDQLSYVNLDACRVPGLHLPFSLSQLPSTLRHLVITAQENFTPCVEDMQLRYRDTPESQLPELRTVVLGDMRGWSGQLMRLLPLHQLERFELISSVPEPLPQGKTSATKVKLTYPLQHETAPGKVIEVDYKSSFDVYASGILEPLTLMDCTQK